MGKLEGLKAISLLYVAQDPTLAPTAGFGLPGRAEGRDYDSHETARGKSR